MDRYFVDERGGCIAVRDKLNIDPDYNGLEPYAKGVIKYWSGILIQQSCPTCGNKMPQTWEINDIDRTNAYTLCAELNKQKEDSKNE